MLFLVKRFRIFVSTTLAVIGDRYHTMGRTARILQNVYLPARGESYQTDRSSALAIERGTRNKPKILFADEPTANPGRISST